MRFYENSSAVAKFLKTFLAKRLLMRMGGSFEGKFYVDKLSFHKIHKV